MPELPEVETVRRGLAAHVSGRRIAAVTFGSARVHRRHLAGPDDLAARLAGRDVRSAERRGKYLWLVLGDEAPDRPDEALVLHLGMSGQLLVEAADAPPERHLHATFTFADGGPQLRFVDQRTFGGMAVSDLVPDVAVSRGFARPYGVPVPVAHIAADPLEAGFDQPRVVARLKAKHTELKRALLDQTVVSGVGNIYADEALWRARVHGRRICSQLTRPALRRVLDHAGEVMLEALGKGGTSFDALYVDVNGASGYFDRSLDAYGQDARPCRRCGAPIAREAFMNRSSYFCPRCQPRPRRR